MKKLALAIAVLLSINISNVWAENHSTNASSVRYVKAPRFARPLVEKWITEYAKTQPGVEFKIAKGNQNQSNIDLNVVFDNHDTKPEDFSHTVVYFGEFAVLPITASGSEAAKVLEGKHLNSKKLKQLYFLDDDYDEEVKKNKQFEKLVIYSGSNASSVASSFARNFGKRVVVSAASVSQETTYSSTLLCRRIRWAYRSMPCRISSTCRAAM